MLGLAELVTGFRTVNRRHSTPRASTSFAIVPLRACGLGARTVTYLRQLALRGVRRLFLFVERSVRDAVGWAVFLPIPRPLDGTGPTIRSFLYSLWNRDIGWADPPTPQCSVMRTTRWMFAMVYTVAGIPSAYPAEFVRIRFRQAPMEYQAVKCQNGGRN